MKKIVVHLLLILSIFIPVVTQMNTIPVKAETGLRVAVLPKSYYISDKLFIVRYLSQTKYYEEYRNGLKYSGNLRLTDYIQDSDGFYLAYYSGTISR